MKNPRLNDIAIRLPASKKHLKSKLIAIAKKNGLTLTQVVTIALEHFLSSPDVSIKIK
jgi:hypothetical protein